MAHLTPSNQLLPILRATPNLQHLAFDCEITQYGGGLSEELFDDDVIFRPGRQNNRASKRRKTSPESEDEFDQGDADAGYSDDGQC